MRFFTHMRLVSCSELYKRSLYEPQALLRSGGLFRAFKNCGRLANKSSRAIHTHAPTRTTSNGFSVSVTFLAITPFGQSFFIFQCLYFLTFCLHKDQTLYSNSHSQLEEMSPFAPLSGSTYSF